MLRSLQDGLVGNVLGVQPNADGVFLVLDRNEFRIPLRRKSAESSDQIQLILFAREERVYHLHRDFYFDLRPSWLVLLEDMNEQGAVMLGDADIRVSILHGDEFAVPGSAHGVHKRPQINAMAIDVVKLYPATV